LISVWRCMVFKVFILGQRYQLMARSVRFLPAHYVEQVYFGGNVQLKKCFDVLLFRWQCGVSFLLSLSWSCIPETHLRRTNTLANLVTVMLQQVFKNESGGRSFQLV
jgi:hypothetical protein